MISQIDLVTSRELLVEFYPLGIAKARKKTARRIVRVIPWNAGSIFSRVFEHVAQVLPSRRKIGALALERI